MPKVNFDDAWAKIELFRWQYGHLPFNDDRKMDVKKGIEGIIKGIETRNPDKMITPYNLCQVLKYLVKIIP